MTTETPAALIDSINALIAVMEQESELLVLRGASATTRELAEAKTRLAARMEQQVARLNRETPGWHQRLETDERTALAEVYHDLHNASVVNSDILQRQIDLSTDMLHAVGMEIERLTGRGHTSYCRKGAVRTAKGKPPLSVNTRL